MDKTVKLIVHEDNEEVTLIVNGREKTYDHKYFRYLYEGIADILSDVGIYPEIVDDNGDKYEA